MYYFHHHFSNFLTFIFFFFLCVHFSCAKNDTKTKIGIMEVILVDAHDLTKSNFLSKIDAYVVIKYMTQEHNSTIAKGQGKNPKWNEKFSFRVEYPGTDKQPKLVLNVMDRDTFSSDDYIGKTTIYLKELLELGVENGTANIRTQKYRVVDSSQSYRGDLRVGVTFTPRGGNRNL